MPLSLLLTSVPLLYSRQHTRHTSERESFRHPLTQCVGVGGAHNDEIFRLFTCCSIEPTKNRFPSIVCRFSFRYRRLVRLLFFLPPTFAHTKAEEKFFPFFHLSEWEFSRSPSDACSDMTLLSGFCWEGEFVVTRKAAGKCWWQSYYTTLLQGGRKNLMPGAEELFITFLSSARHRCCQSSRVIHNDIWSSQDFYLLLFIVCQNWKIPQTATVVSSVKMNDNVGGGGRERKGNGNVDGSCCGVGSNYYSRQCWWVSSVVSYNAECCLITFH